MTRPDLRPEILLPAIAVLAILFAAPAASAAPPGSVTVDVGVVIASNEGNSIDPGLAGLRAKLQSMFNYTSYKMLDRKRHTYPVGETAVFKLPGGRSMRVTPVPAPPKKVRLDVRIAEDGRNVLTTTLGLSRGGMVLVGGPPYQSGVMILLISAE